MDISKKMLVRAIRRAEAAGMTDRTSFLVSDGNSLPFEDGSFDCTCTYGVLHHLPDPARSCLDLIRVLKRGGTFLASENNESAFRTVFDAMMRWRPLWNELAGKEPLISRSMMESWLSRLPVERRFHTMVFAAVCLQLAWQRSGRPAA